MKVIRIEVNGDPFLIEECDGRAEIRPAKGPKCYADRKWSGKVGDVESEEVHVTLTVETIE